ncbi:MAG TPA: FlgD immunoglobulin-like domain containing protein [Candidatus Goldiibacteriota bacterium]|nr:FlgD immunoglobulin-like domain containing protein [Candidatus Goldiibacteriota bacterium]
MPVDAAEFDPGSAVLVGTLLSDFTQTSGNNNWWYGDFNFVVSDNSGLWVTVDIASVPGQGTVEFQGEGIAFNSGAADILDLPASPPVMLITQTTPADLLEITHEAGTMQTAVSTGQENIIPCSFKFYNASGPDSAPIVASGLTVTVQSFSPLGVTLNPSSIIQSIKLQDKNTGTVYGSVSGALLPAGAYPVEIPLSLLNIPAETTITANVVISAVSSTYTAGANFVFSLNEPSSFSAYDFYTLNSVTVSASAADTTGFPMYSNFSALQKNCGEISASFTDVIPLTINEGQVNVPLVKMILSNPGNSLTASGQAYNLKFQVTDNSGAPIVPSSLFSKISVTDLSGTIIYAIKDSTIESSGSIINIPLINTIGIPSASSATVTVRANISSSTTADDFRIIIIPSSDILARDINSFSPASVTSASSVYTSPSALLSSSLKAGVTPLMPKTLYSGQNNVSVMQLSLSSPLSFGEGNTIMAYGITLTAKDINGAPVDASSFISDINISITSPSVSENVSITAPSSSTVFIPFTSPIPLTSSASTIISVSCSIKTTAPTGSIRLDLGSASAIGVYQYLDPLKAVAVSASAGQSFPMSSGAGTIAGPSEKLSFSTFPNPFRYGSKATLSYYLDSDSEVTITVFDLTGRAVKKIREKSILPAGARDNDFWDGRDSNGRTAIAGTYLIKIESVSGGKTKTETKKITLIK